MSILIVTTPAHAPLALGRRLARAALSGLGALLMIVGLIGALLPGHLGLPLLIVGLILVLRSSREARRRFIGLQRRHPRVLFPIRRLLRRDPEIIAVAWQQALRMERAVLPRSWRRGRSLRRRWFGRRRAAPAK